MFFKQIQNKMFPSGFFISDNRIFAIGIVGKAIQILSKMSAHWAIIREYKTTDENMKREWLAKILKSLEPAIIKDSEAMKKILPEMKEKQYNIKKVTTRTIIPDSKITSNLIDVKKNISGTIISDEKTTARTATKGTGTYLKSNLKSKEKQYESHGPEQESTKKNNTKSRKEEWKQKRKGF